MAKKQTRRSISVRGTTYNQLRDYCGAATISMSDFVEQRIADFFKDKKVVAMPAPKLAVVAAPAARKLPAPVAVAVAVAAPIPPVSSIVVKKPAAAAIAALRSAMPAAGSNAVRGKEAGRPAPTPAAEVVKTRYSVPTVKEGGSKDGKDYRAIRF